MPDRYHRRLVRAPGSSLPPAANQALLVEQDDLLAALRLDCSERGCPEVWRLERYPQFVPSLTYMHGQYRLAPQLLEMRAALQIMADGPRRAAFQEHFLDTFDHWLDELHGVCSCGNGEARPTEYGAPH